jgi:hypothetical protein
MEKTTLNLKKRPRELRERLWEALQLAVKIEKDGIDSGDEESFDLFEELDEYRKAHGNMESQAHDLSKWSKHQREQYSLDRFNDFEDSWF